MKWARCIALCLVTLPLAGTALGAKDPSGIWKWTVERNNRKREMTLTLKLEGDKLTGHMPGPNNTVMLIDDAKYADGEVSFSFTREFNGVKRTNKFKGKVSSDTITGVRESRRDGKPQTTEWIAKKSL